MAILRQRIEDLKIRNYSPRNIEIYVERVAKFARYFGQSPDKLGPDGLQRRILWPGLRHTQPARPHPPPAEHVYVPFPMPV